jgi:hypothetical protein
LPAASCSGSIALVNNGVSPIEFKTNATKVIDLYNGTDADGTAIRPFAKNGTTTQQWVAVSTGEVTGASLRM